MNSFPKSARLLSRQQYQHLAKYGKQVVGDYIVIEKFKNQNSMINLGPKLGLTVSRRFGKAHLRNRFKRIVREAFRHLIPILPKDLYLNIKPRSLAQNASFHDIYEELVCLLNLHTPATFSSLAIKMDGNGYNP